MPRFNQENMLDVLELQQLVAEWCKELDDNDGLDATRFFTEDCIVKVGSMSYQGHEAMEAFYRGVAQYNRATDDRPARIMRHTFTGLGIAFGGSDRATVTFLSINFSGCGKAPLIGATVPSVISDVRFECRRDERGEWRVAEFDGSPIFAGDDPYMNQLLIAEP